ncbi:Inositol 2-dehydrogenase/D-chiro-inositol 3-dehydrogenase [Roseimaritima multifibrata]|uniref:Inositol 2-dehydrogenase/D-chiro-inositol 3-dehydrogenase n=1 Tax=Roseimaritima multifibrata TaxID=1930274 RepID=A0A517MM63_9BACT|nr:Inositol 2-dehydrogenase/D-chiro-inositol 3-dehydrogenase [Roseimaritima multifibrata]
MDADARGQGGLNSKRQAMAVIGGGRWARVLLTVLRDLVSQLNGKGTTEIDSIFWVTDHAPQAAQVYLDNQQWENVSLVPRSKIPFSELVAGVVASSPRQHFADCQLLLDAKVPVLCEKPLVTSSREAGQLQALAAKQKTPLGVELPLMHAGFFRDFSRSVAGCIPDKIQIRWCDPWQEIRHGERKSPELTTDYITDMFPHVWSLLNVVRPDWRLKSIESVTYSPEQIQVECRWGEEVLVESVFSRRAETRERRFWIEPQQRGIDFAVEPGWTLAGVKRTDNPLCGERPLTRSLRRFLEVAHGQTAYEDWEASVDRCLDSVEWTEALSARLQAEQENQLNRLVRDNAFDIDCPEHRNRLIDRWFPELSRTEANALLKSPARFRQWATQIVDDLGKR